MRLDKFLADCAKGSRKDIKKMISKGLVTLDGKVCKNAQTPVCETSKITLCGEEIKYEKYIYLMMNKPKGYISATEDLRKKTVLDLLCDEYRHYSLFPAGRLDIDTEGFLLLTNDGGFAHNILSPKKHVDKTYFAKTDGCVTDEHAALFANSVTLDDGYKTLPARLVILKSGENSSEVEITVREGKFHQIKRMFEAIGMHVVYLKRIAMGALYLDESLKAGEVKKLTKDDIEKIIGGQNGYNQNALQ